ncbi:MAG: Major outer membrane protein P.IB [Cellvibrionales bacterium UBA7375]|nr:MAG: Major outer membrane protein P.IB [Cellvibrionales bacterium UBA7375]|tara:strand:- start:1297 stop:2214 length:918 start_codon:yes stop_codon:yes gene_type:complete
MNKVILLGTATAMLATAPFAAASGSIDGKLYGKINVSVVNSDSGSEDTWKLNSNASRIGLKGSNQVSEGLTVFYKTEFQVEVDGDGDVFKQRNIYAGIKGQYGSLLAGKNDTPTKLAQKKIDLFNDLEGDIMKTFAGENPVSNIIAYTTPKYGNFSATYAVMPSEANNGGLSDATSYSVNYSKGDLYVAIAGNSNVVDIDLVRVDLVRVVSQFKVDAWQLGLMYQDNDTTDESGYFASAAYKIDNITYKAQYGSNENDTGGSDKTTLSLGADFKLAKNTKSFVFFTDNEESSSTKTFGLGLEHKF